MMIDKIKALPEKKALAIGLDFNIRCSSIVVFIVIFPLNWHLDYKDH